MFFSAKVPPKARDAYGKDAMSGMLGAVMSGLTASFVPVIARETLHAGSTQLAIISMAPVAGHPFSLLWANWMEGRRKMPFAVVSWIIARSMLFLTAFATTSITFIGLWFISNFISSIAGPAYSALMKEIYPDGDRARIMGYARVCTFGSYVVITLIAGWLLKLDRQAYRVVFPIAGLFGITATLSFNRIASSDTTGDSSVPFWRFAWDGLKILHHDPGFRWFSGAIFLFGFANFMAGPAYAIYQVDILGVDTRWAGVYSTISSVLTMVGYFYWGGYIDRRAPERVIAMQALIWAAIPMVHYFATAPWMIIPSAIVMGVINAGVDLAYFNGVLHFAPTEKLTQYQAIFALLMGIRGIIAPLLGAWLIRTHVIGLVGTKVDSLRMTFLITTAMILMSVLLQLAGERRHGTIKDAV